ncbi:MAG: hypothetical protein GEU89_21730, partial [Kiloniellaceae bacterium]|nr:hypothetical protein [Kiloniellaceae bacterium]
MVSVALMALASAARDEPDYLAHAATAAAEGTSPAGELGDMVLYLATVRLQRLAAHGVVTMKDTSVTVPRGLRASLIPVLRAYGMEAEVVDGRGEPVDYELPDLYDPGGGSGHDGPVVYQVKVQLDGARPPIWRPAAMPSRKMSTRSGGSPPARR